MSRHPTADGFGQTATVVRHRRLIETLTAVANEHRDRA
jgi:hypothetical protein